MDLVTPDYHIFFLFIPNHHHFPGIHWNESFSLYNIKWTFNLRNIIYIWVVVNIVPSMFQHNKFLLLLHPNQELLFQLDRVPYFRRACIILTWKLVVEICPMTLWWSFQTLDCFNLLIAQPVFSCTWKTTFLESHCYQKLTSLKKSHICPFIIRLWISSSIALKYSSAFSPDRTSIYVGVSGSWLQDLKA